MSKYFQTLTGDAHERYLDKIEIIGGEDVMLWCFLRQPILISSIILLLGRAYFIS